jgi:hypothetical protein
LPDVLVYCGFSPLLITGEDTIEKDIKNYISQFGTFPACVIYMGKFYILAESVRKCQDIQELLKTQIYIVHKLGENFVPLNDEKLRYLSNMESERYRKSLGTEA